LLGQPTSAPVLRLDWQQDPQNAPFCFGEIAPAQVRLQRAALNQGEVPTSVHGYWDDCFRCFKRAFSPASFDEMTEDARQSLIALGSVILCIGFFIASHSLLKNIDISSEFFCWA
jgi:hypothetical protein